MMELINCIIIDDEPLARKGLKEYINEIDFLHLSGEYEQPLQAISILATGQVQLVFLDIQMPKISGLDFLKSQKQAPPVIFTTAYPQFAISGFDLNAVDYLVKPISFDRFFRSALKAKEYYEIREKNNPANSSRDAEASYCFIKADNKLVKIFFEDILFAEALQNYVKIYTTGKNYVTWLTFKAVEEYLPANKFLKVHKSFIINASRTNSILANELIIDSHHIPISRVYKKDVKNTLLKGKFLKR